MFSSNRPGGKGGDDVYNFYTLPLMFALVGIIKDVETGDPIAGATMHVTGSDGLDITLTTNETGTLELAEKADRSYHLQPGQDYTIKVNHPDYYAASAKESTVGLEESITFEHTFSLKAIPKGPEKMPMVLYAYDDAKLLPESSDSLDYVYNLMMDNPNIVVRMEAHTDLRGSAAYNKRLSEARAQACVSYLVQRGIPADRLEWKGYGEEKPVFTEKQIAVFATEEERDAAHARNRRTEFTVVSTTYNAR